MSTDKDLQVWLPSASVTVHLPYADAVQALADIPGAMLASASDDLPTARLALRAHQDACDIHRNRVAALVARSRRPAG